LVLLLDVIGAEFPVSEREDVVLGLKDKHGEVQLSQLKVNVSEWVAPVWARLGSGSAPVGVGPLIKGLLEFI